MKGYCENFILSRERSVKKKPLAGRGGEGVRETVQMTLRLPADLHRTARFIAADRGVSMNEVLIQLLREAVEGLQISPPTGLLSPVRPR